LVIGLDQLGDRIHEAVRAAFIDTYGYDSSTHVALAEVAIFGPAGEMLVPVRVSRAGAAAGISDDALVRFDPTRLDDAINAGGVQQRYFEGGKVWLTKYGDVKHITNARELEKILYRQNLWDATTGKFIGGATLRVVRNTNDAVSAGVTNMVNGVRQSRVLRDIPPDDIQIIKIILGE
jgi:hypothetical protein